MSSMTHSCRQVLPESHRCVWLCRTVEPPPKKQARPSQTAKPVAVKDSDLPELHRRVPAPSEVCSQPKP